MILSSSRSRQPTPSPRTPIAVTFARGVIVAGILLTLVSAVIRLTWRYQYSIPKPVRELLVVNKEISILSWLSISVMFVLGLTCIVAGRLERRRGWYPIAALFIFLSMDDSTTLHERIGWLLTSANGDSPVYWWVRVLGPILAVLGLFTFVFLWKRYADNLRSRLTTLAGFGCLGLALLCEIPERFFHDSNLSWRGFSIERYTMHLEELCELVGPVLILIPIGVLVETLAVASIRDANERAPSERSPRLLPKPEPSEGQPEEVA